MNNENEIKRIFEERIEAAILEIGEEGLVEGYFYEEMVQDMSDVCFRMVKATIEGQQFFKKEQIAVDEIA